MARDSARARRICVEAHSTISPGNRRVMQCHVCKSIIDCIKDASRWRADHIRRYAEGGQDTPENLHPICLDCDTGKDGKAADDTREVAKGKRVSDKHWGVRKTKRGFRKAPDGFNTFTKTWKE